MGKWATLKNQTQTWQYMAWSLDTIIQESKKKQEIKEWENKIPSFKQHTHKESYEVSTDDKDYLKVNADVRS